MKRRMAKKLSLTRETLLNIGLVRGSYPPTPIGSDCEACITIVQPDTQLMCGITGPCVTGDATACDCTFGQMTC
jgi:hypothetical protein